MVINVTIEPCIFSNDNLNWASQRIGPLRTVISGRNKMELFENLQKKLSAMSVAEAKIEDADIAREYNLWIAKLYKQSKVPSEINDYFTAKMSYAIPFSERFKTALRNGNA